MSTSLMPFSCGLVQPVPSLSPKAMVLAGKRRALVGKIMERVLDELSFDASEREEGKFVVTAEYVSRQLSNIVEDQDLSRFIL